jgi:hypothetical protein
LALAALFALIAAPAIAAPDLFADGAPPLHFTLTAPFGTLTAKAKYTLDAYPGTLSADGEPQTLQIKIRPRGISRRKMYCAFPPLYLEFDKETTHGTLFHGHKQLKLVTYCKPMADFEQRVMLESLVYKFLNKMTPVSFRVRPAEVTYRNGPNDAGVTRFGYLIEDIGGVGARNGLGELKGPSHMVSLAQLDPRAATRVDLLEFMIGNNDWEQLASAPTEACCHNIKLLAAQGTTPSTAKMVMPVPYDFDSTGFVDPPYAGPPEGIPIDSLTERYYRGYCALNDQVPAVAEEFLSHRADFHAVIDNEPGLDAHFRDKADKYLDGFFAVLTDPQRLQSQVLKHCR